VNELEHTGRGHRDSDRVAGVQSHRFVSTLFEGTFSASDFDALVQECYRNDVEPWIREHLEGQRPIVEAGSGSGRWVAWAGGRGWETIGVDWSEELCRVASAQIPSGQFLSADLRALPFRDASVGGLISLGAVEHSSEGPFGSLAEHARVLQRGGVAVITVPYSGPVRRATLPASYILSLLKAWRWLRRRTGRRVGSRRLAEARRETRSKYTAKYLHGPEGWAFFEYQLTRKQFRDLVASVGLEVTHEFVLDADQGLMHTFGRLAGRWNEENLRVEPSTLGRILTRLLPSTWTAHMVGCVAVKNA
jgi:SAM-dependent methyltransferase